jgi:hypothetical protein
MPAQVNDRSGLSALGIDHEGNAAHGETVANDGRENQPFFERQSFG